MHFRTVAQIIACTGVLVFADTLQAQDHSSTSPVELVGLHHWTRQMVKDSLLKKVPGSDTSLSTHACGAEMREIGFLRGSAIYYPTRILVAVVEPQDSALVTLNPPITTTRTLPADWQAILQPFLGSDGKFANGLMQLGVKYYPLVQAGKIDSLRKTAPIPAPLDAFWMFLLARTKDADRIQALDILKNDSVDAHRTFALAVLNNFAASDEVWNTLLHVMRDPNDKPGAWMVAQGMLLQWSTTSPRKVDWTASTADLRSFFSAVNPWALPDVMRIVTLTKIDPALARSILKGHDIFVRGWAASGDPQAAKIGAELLAQAQLPKVGS